MSSVAAFNFSLLCQCWGVFPAVWVCTEDISVPDSSVLRMNHIFFWWNTIKPSQRKYRSQGHFSETRVVRGVYCHGNYQRCNQLIIAVAISPDHWALQFFLFILWSCSQIYACLSHCLCLDSAFPQNKDFKRLISLSRQVSSDWSQPWRKLMKVDPAFLRHLLLLLALDSELN